METHQSCQVHVAADSLLLWETYALASQDVPESIKEICR